MGACCTQNVAVSTIDINMQRSRICSCDDNRADAQNPSLKQLVSTHTTHTGLSSMDLMITPLHGAIDSGIVDLQTRDSDIVFGYIRQCIEPAIAEYTIPTDIISICTAYYHWSFGFEAIKTLSGHPAVVEIAGPYSETVHTLITRAMTPCSSRSRSRTPSPLCSRMHCAFGNQWVASLSGKQISYRIRVNAFSDRSKIYIGFASTEQFDLHSFGSFIDGQRGGGDLSMHLMAGDGRGYSFGAVRGQLAPVQEGDVVTLDLDLRDGTLTLRNGHPALMLFTDIRMDEETQYKLVVILGDNDSATILDYAEIKT